MTSWAVCIAGSYCNLPRLLSFAKQLEHFFCRMRLHDCCFVLAALITLGHYVGWVQQVTHLVTVYFLERDANDLLIRIDCLQNLVNSSWHNTLFAQIFLGQTICAHGVSLPAACLTVWKYTHIVTIKKACNKVLHFIINLCLCTCLWENAVKKEGVFLCLLWSCCSLAWLWHSNHFKLNLLRIGNDELPFKKIKRVSGACVGLEVIR